MPNFYNLLRARKFTTAADTAVEIAPYDSATPNFVIEAGGKLKWSSGSATADTTLYRSAADTLKTDDSFEIGSGQTYKVDGADVLSGTTLGSGITGSSLTSVGSLTSLTAATPYFVGPAVFTGGNFTLNAEGDGSFTGTLTSIGALTAATPNFTGPASFSSSATVSGNLTVNGTTTTINSDVEINGSLKYRQAFNSQGTNTSVYLVSSDKGKIVTFNSSSNVTVYVNTSTNLVAGDRIDILNLGSGTVTISASGVTVNATPGLKLRAQYSGGSLICITDNSSYVLIGDLMA